MAHEHEPNGRPETPLEQLDRVDRGRWIRAAVGILIEGNPLEVLQLMVGGGEEQFIRIARQHWDVHKFQRSDYEFAFRQIRKAVAKAERQRTTIHG